MQSYSVRDVERLLRLSRSTIRGLTAAGFLSPSRGPRREYRFSFQDLIVLRAARALIEGKIPRRRIHRALDELRRSLPDALPLSGLSISAIGERIVVRQGKNRWQLDGGQYLLGLDVSVEDGVLRVVERKEPSIPSPDRDTEDWFSRALELETADLRSAASAYERAVNDDPAHLAAWLNWGRVLHELGQLEAAQAVYRRALEKCGPDALLWFNLGVLLQDHGRIDEALDAYRCAVGEDPNLADCHYNMALLYESLGKPQHAIRHLGQYRRLVTPGD